jgi:hypothetical protein
LVHSTTRVPTLLLNRHWPMKTFWKVNFLWIAKALSCWAISSYRQSIILLSNILLSPKHYPVEQYPLSALYGAYWIDIGLWIPYRIDIGLWKFPFSIIQSPLAYDWIDIGLWIAKALSGVLSLVLPLNRNNDSEEIPQPSRRRVCYRE